MRPATVALALVLGACSGGDTSAPAPTTSASGTVSSTAARLVPPSWRPLAPAPVARQEVAAAAFGDRVWVIGGLVGGEASTLVETYNPATDSWLSQTALPYGLHHAAATVYRGELVVVGGFTSSGDLYSQPTDRVLALRDGAWVDLPRLRRPRGAAAAAAVGETLLVVGGRDTGALIAPSEAFDGTAWADKAPIPEPRDHLTAAADGQALYAVGGRTLAASQTTGAAERYDPGTNAWTPIPEMPTPRGGHGMALAGGRLVAVGGESATEVFPQVEAFDLATGAWSDLPPLGVPRHGLAVASVGSVIYALVGGTEAGLAPSAVAEDLA